MDKVAAIEKAESHCKGFSCTKNKHDAFQCNVKEATSQKFQIWYY